MTHTALAVLVAIAASAVVLAKVDNIMGWFAKYDPAKAKEQD